MTSFAQRAAFGTPAAVSAATSSSYEAELAETCPTLPVVAAGPSVASAVAVAEVAVGPVAAVGVVAPPPQAATRRVRASTARGRRVGAGVMGKAPSGTGGRYASDFLCCR